jgi:hypothetical protein
VSWRLSWSLVVLDLTKSKLDSPVELHASHDHVPVPSSQSSARPFRCSSSTLPSIIIVVEKLRLLHLLESLSADPLKLPHIPSFYLATSHIAILSSACHLSPGLHRSFPNPLGVLSGCRRLLHPAFPIRRSKSSTLASIRNCNPSKRGFDQNSGGF